jgi:type II secretory ATPase GspE/PulE/Tfp pilus assembly ATPase PilB-like protein
MTPEDSTRNPLAPRQYDLGHRDPMDAPVVALTNLILAEGLRNKASAVRLVASVDTCLVHYLVAGEWRLVMTVPSMAGNPAINRLRIMADLDPTTKARPRSGEIHAMLDGTPVILKVDVHANPDGSQESIVSLPRPAA